jgi:predicted exporter
VTRRATVTLALWLGALAACVAVIVHTRFSADLSAFLPAAPDARQRALIEQLKSGVAARTLLIGIRGGDAAQRAAASRALAQRLRADGQFEQVLNGDFAAFEAVGQWVVEHRYQISPAVNPQRFSADGLREAIDDTLALLGTPAGSSVKPLLLRDPTGEVQRFAESALSGGGPRTQDGVWVSRDGQRALLMAQSRAAGADLDAQARALQTIEQTFGAVAAPGLQLDLSGAPRFAVDSRDRIRGETKALALTGTFVMGGLLLLAFASWHALGAAVLPVASGIVAGVASVSLVFGGVHGMTLGFGTTLIGEAVDYAIYYLIQARAANGGAAGSATATTSAAEPGWRRWLREGWPTVRLGVMTSVCGFLALAFSGFPGLAQLGVFSIAGLIAAALTTRFVLPLALPNGTPGVGLRRHLGRWSAMIVQRAPRVRHMFTALGLFAVLVLVWRHDRLWESELSSLSPVSGEALALDAELRAELLAGDERTMVAVIGTDLESLLQRVEAVSAQLDALVRQGQLVGYDAITRWLPSQATQQRRRAALPDATTLRAQLDAATEGGSLAARRLEPFIADVQRARDAPWISAASLAATPVAPITAALLVRADDGRATALLPLMQTPGGDADALHATLEQTLRGIDGAHVLGIGDELRRLYRHYLREAQAQALFGALGVVLLMMAWLRSLPRLLAVCKPLLLAVLLTMAGFALAGVPLGILHLVGLLLVVAVGSNYSLFMDWLRHQAAADEDMLASLLLANITIVLSFGLIALSQIPALSAIGRVVAPGALLALLLSAAYASPSARARV